jgi:PAS domain S-box-containing protein
VTRGPSTSPPPPHTSLAFGDRPRDGLLSALAEAPDYAAAASFLLAELASFTQTRRGALLRFDPVAEELVLVALHGFASAEEAAASDAMLHVLDNGSLGLAPQVPEPERVGLWERAHPLIVSTLTLSPVVGPAPLPGPPSLTAFATWTALPMPQPHYRGAPALWSDAHAAEALAPIGARVVPLAERRFSSAPGGVVALEGLLDDAVIQEVASLVMLAGPVLGRLAALETAERSEERVRQERDRLTLMIDSLPDPVVITNAANDIVLHNKRALHLFAVNEGDSPGRRRAVELNNLLFTSFLSKAVMTVGPDSGARELNLVDPDEGDDVLFEVLAHAIGERVGPEDAFLSVLRDVTDLRRATRELEWQVQRVRQAEVKATSERDRLNLILENVADPILVTDDQSNIILMNDQAEQLFQITDPSSRSRRELIAIRGNDTKFTSFISDFMLQEDRARREQMSLVVPSGGQELPVEVVSGKITNERGEPIAIVSVLHDLTKQAENERLYETLKQLNTQLEERVRAAVADLAEQNARLQWQSHEVERANRLKSEFLASMSHELRTPINALLGYASLMLEGVFGKISEDQREAMERSRAAADHLLNLVNDILDLAKIEAGKMPLIREPVTITEVVTEVSQQIEPLVRKKALAYEIVISPECPALETDRTKLKQVLLNLLSNAMKFTNRGGITVSAAPHDGGVRIDVVDTGIGIQEKDLAVIWEDFRQIDQSRTREYGGTGLGLSITRRLLDRLGGSVTVESTYGAGSTFSVFLPLTMPVPADLSEESDAAVSSRPMTEI